MPNRALSSLIFSLTSALVGWMAGMVISAAGMIFLGGNPFAGALLVGLGSAPVILLVCLFLLWPLYALVPRSSVLWKPGVCVSCGLAAGGLLAAALFSSDWSQEGSYLLLVLATLIGGATCFVGSQLNKREPGYVEPSSLPRIPNPFSVPARWLAERFADWSGQ